MERYGISSDMPTTGKGSSSVSKRTGRTSTPGGRTGSSRGPTPHTTAASCPAATWQRTVSAKYTPLPVLSGFCAVTLRILIAP